MVGFNTAIKTSHQASCKLPDQTDPLTDFSEFPDSSLPLFDHLPEFDFIDDWIVDNDPLNMSTEENLETLVVLPNQEISIQETGLDSLIEEVMGKVSLAGASESSDLVNGNQEIHESVPELKPQEIGVLLASEVPISYEVLGELKSTGNVEELIVGNNECLDELKENGEVGNLVALVTDQVKVEDMPVEKNSENRVIVSDGEDSSSSSSDSESEVESDSSSSSSSSSEEDEEEKMDESLEVEEGEIKDFDPEGILIGSDEDEPAIKGPIKSKNEVEFLPPVPPVDVSLQPHHQTLPVGVVLSVMDAKVVVEGREKHNPLNEGSILWITETRSPLGRVDEIFGPVKNPFYIVRYNSEQEVPAGITEGIPVSFVADFADHVLNDKNLYKKGYDASGENDEEISEEVEFSDDEKEAEYRRAQKMANKGASDRKRGNRDSDARKKIQHKGSWKNNQPPAQASGGHTGQTSSPNQFHSAPVEASFSCGTYAGSSSAGPGSASRPTPAPPASQVANPNCHIPQNLVPGIGGWTNGMAGQLQQHMVFPNGFQINGMPMQQLNHYQQPPQMLNGFPGGMPFQQQFNPNQGMMHNVPLPYGQPNFSQGTASPWPGHLGQPGFNQVQFGMGVQGHHVPTYVNAGVLQGTSNGSQNEQSNETRPPSNMQGNFSSHQQHSQGRSTRGRGSYGRSGGRFSGRRGRQ